jgi:preprotein translocase subunit SecF
MRFKWLYFLLSGIVIIPGIFSLIRFGLRPAIDFTGGTLLEYKFSQSFSPAIIKTALEAKHYEVNLVQESGVNTYLLRMPPVDKGKAATIRIALGETFQEMPEETRFETVGPILGKELLFKALIAIILAAGAILSYVAWRFKNAKFGICAILAMFHDSLVLLGSFSLMGHFFGVEVDTLFVTAMLTILSFSVHDTVVVYDRIRESQKLLPNVDFEQLVNKAVTETLSRSLNNSLTIIFMLIALMLLGGTTIKWFVAALLIGTISGTYSSTFNAAPLLVVWEKIAEKRKR